ncbi:hypothetical protein J6590_063394, partial [Homalodisca vitripennis]
MNYGFNCLTIRLTHQIQSQANSFRSFISKLRSEDKDDRQMKRQSPTNMYRLIVRCIKRTNMDRSLHADQH